MSALDPKMVRLGQIRLKSSHRPPRSRWDSEVESVETVTVGRVSSGGAGRKPRRFRPGSLRKDALAPATTARGSIGRSRGKVVTINSSSGPCERDTPEKRLITLCTLTIFTFYILFPRGGRHEHGRRGAVSKKLLVSAKQTITTFRFIFHFYS